MYCMYVGVNTYVYALRRCFADTGKTKIDTKLSPTTLR
jgi:hypothetical protein